jgi:hypothetical protein
MERKRTGVARSSEEILEAQQGLRQIGRAQGRQALDLHPPVAPESGEGASSSPASVRPTVGTKSDPTEDVLQGGGPAAKGQAYSAW